MPCKVPPILPEMLPLANPEPQVVAGRCAGQTSPSIWFMFLDGRLEQVFRFTVEMLNYHKAWGKLSFKSAWLEQVSNRKMVQWDWLPSTTLQ